MLYRTFRSDVITFHICLLVHLLYFVNNRLVYKSYISKHFVNLLRLHFLCGLHFKKNKVLLEPKSSVTVIAALLFVVEDLYRELISAKSDGSFPQASAFIWVTIYSSPIAVWKEKPTVTHFFIHTYICVYVSTVKSPLSKPRGLCN